MCVYTLTNICIMQDLDKIVSKFEIDINDHFIQSKINYYLISVPLFHFLNCTVTRVLVIFAVFLYKCHKLY